MRRHRKTLTLAAAALTASLAGLGALGASAGAAAATSGPVILLYYTVCNSSGVCTPGPGDVGVAYYVGVHGATAAEDGLFAGTITVASGSLPPGLQLSGSDGLYQISGTPTAAGTYDFTLQITYQGVSETQPFFITVGTGTADELVGAATLTNLNLFVAAYDPNIGATYTVYLTSTGQELGTMIDNNGGYPLSLGFSFDARPDVSAGVTIKDSLGSSVTVPVTVIERKY